MVYIFKTSVKTKKHIQVLEPLLSELCKQGKWNFDLEDCDKILRIDSPQENSDDIIKLLNGKDFECEELGCFQ